MFEDIALIKHKEFNVKKDSIAGIKWVSEERMTMVTPTLFFMVTEKETKERYPIAIKNAYGNIASYNTALYRYWAGSSIKLVKFKKIDMPMELSFAKAYYNENTNKVVTRII